VVSFDPHSLRFCDRLIVCECAMPTLGIEAKSGVAAPAHRPLTAAQAACLADDFDHDVIGNEPSFKSQIE
jgi:hypothetical protein